MKKFKGRSDDCTLINRYHPLGLQRCSSCGSTEQQRWSVPCLERPLYFHSPHSVCTVKPKPCNHSQCCSISSLKTLCSAAKPSGCIRCIPRSPSQLEEPGKPAGFVSIQDDKELHKHKSINTPNAYGLRSRRLCGASLSACQIPQSSSVKSFWLNNGAGQVWCSSSQEHRGYSRFLVREFDVSSPTVVQSRTMRIHVASVGNKSRVHPAALSKSDGVRRRVRVPG